MNIPNAIILLIVFGLPLGAFALDCLKTQRRLDHIEQRRKFHAELT